MSWTLTKGLDDTIIGTVYPPIGTPYYGAPFFVNVVLPDGYPVYPPRVQMTSRIFHPNFTLKGHLYIDKLYDEYTPDFTLSKVMDYILQLFSHPDMDPLSQNNLEAGTLYKEDREKFEEKARDWTLKYCL